MTRPNLGVASSLRSGPLRSAPLCPAPSCHPSLTLLNLRPSLQCPWRGSGGTVNLKTKHVSTRNVNVHTDVDRYPSNTHGATGSQCKDVKLWGVPEECTFTGASVQEPLVVRNKHGPCLSTGLYVDLPTRPCGLESVWGLGAVVSIDVRGGKKSKQNVKLYYFALLFFPDILRSKNDAYVTNCLMSFYKLYGLLVNVARLFMSGGGRTFPFDVTPVFYYKCWLNLKEFFNLSQTYTRSLR